MINYNMNSPEGNRLVERIVEAGCNAVEVDDYKIGFAWVTRELEKLSYGEGFSEAFRPEVAQRVLHEIGIRLLLKKIDM